MTQKWDETSEIIKLALASGTSEAARSDSVHCLVSTIRLAIKWYGKSVPTVKNTSIGLACVTQILCEQFGSATKVLQEKDSTVVLAAVCSLHNHSGVTV